MAWSTPKTTWTASSYVNAYDVARWKNNLAYLYTAVVASGGTVDVFANMSGIGSDYGDVITARNYTIIEQNTYGLSQAIKKMGCLYRYFPTYKSWAANGSAPDYKRLNKVEMAMLNIYNYLQSL